MRARDLARALRLADEILTEGAGAPADNSADAAMIWVIGGGRGAPGEAMNRAELLVVTEIDLEVGGDTTAPAIPQDFRPEEPDPAWSTSHTGTRYRILRALPADSRPPASLARCNGATPAPRGSGDCAVGSRASCVQPFSPDPVTPSTMALEEHVQHHQRERGEDGAGLWMSA